MYVRVLRLPISVNDAAEMMQPWLGEPGMLTDIACQVERFEPASEFQRKCAMRNFRLALKQIRGK